MLSYRISDDIISVTHFSSIFIFFYENVSIQEETFEEKHRKMEAEGERLHQQLEGNREELNDACSRAEEHKETAMIFKQKYMAAIEKVHKKQVQVEHLQEELQYSQQQVEFICIRLFISICVQASNIYRLCIFALCSLKSLNQQLAQCRKNLLRRRSGTGIRSPNGKTRRRPWTS